MGYIAASACTVERDDSRAAAGVSAWALKPPTIVGDGNAIVSVEVTATQATAQPWAGALLRLNADDPHVVFAPLGRADAAGRAATQVRCTAPGQFLLTATVCRDGVASPLLGSATLTCLTPAADVPPAQAAPATLAISPLHDVAAADIVAPVLVTLVVSDAHGDPLAEQTVTLTASRPGDQVVPAVAVTDAQGRVQVTLTATTLGISTIFAHTGAIGASTTVQFVAGAPNMGTSLWLAEAGKAVADGWASLGFDLSLRDALGRGVPYAAISSASDVVGDVLSPALGQTDATGHLRVALAGTRSGSRTVTATSHTGGLAATASLSPGPATAAQSALALNPNRTTADGISPSSIDVRLADALGNAIAGGNVVLASSVPSDVLNGAAASTDLNGELVATIAGTLAGARRVTAMAGNITLGATLTLLPGAPNQTLTTLVATPPQPTAGAPVGLRLQLLDAYGNPIAGGGVRLSSGDSTDNFAPSAAVTDSLGQMTAQFVGTRAGTHVLIASFAVAGTSSACAVSCALNVIAGAPSPATSALVASPNTAVADNVATVGLTATFQDVYANAIAASAVAWAGAGGNDTYVRGASTVTSAGGVAANALRSTWAHGVDATAQVGNLILDVPLGFYAGAANRLEFHHQP